MGIVDEFLEGEIPIRDLLLEKIWSGKVKTKHTFPPGFFKQGASVIAKGLKRASGDLKQAMSRLNFYINRAGKNLSPSDRSRLEKAKEELRKAYGV